MRALNINAEDATLLGHPAVIHHILDNLSNYKTNKFLLRRLTFFRNTAIVRHTKRDVTAADRLMHRLALFFSTRLTSLLSISKDMRLYLGEMASP